MPIAGTPSYTQAAARLILGQDSPAIKDNRVAAVQTISGTGKFNTSFFFLKSPMFVNRLIYETINEPIDYIRRKPYWCSILGKVLQEELKVLHLETNLG